jgi:translation elongation factor EF-4
MTYQYLFCPTCGMRRMGHGYRCSVCSGLLHREVVATRAARPVLRTLVSSRPNVDKHTQPDRVAA